MTACLLLVVAGGCGDEGRYRISWRFVGQSQPATAASCGVHGVESFWVDERSDDGDAQQVQTLCAFGQIERTVPTGRWTVILTGLDRFGRGPMSHEGMVLTATVGPFEVRADGPVPMLLVDVVPRPSCADGVDNDGDGLVDGDDPGCVAGNDEWADAEMP